MSEGGHRTATAFNYFRSFEVEIGSCRADLQFAFEARRLADRLPAWDA